MPKPKLKVFSPYDHLDEDGDTGRVRFENLEHEIELVNASAGASMFGDLVPDAATAYSIVSFSRCVPQIAGPESVSGLMFGIHPAVVARSFPTMVHKQMNLGHELKAFGAKKDKIVGCVLQVAFPDEPEGGWVIPKTVAEAPCITALGALFKQADGVDKFLGNHLSGKIKQAVSMEFAFSWKQAGVYDADNNIVYDPADIPTNILPFTFRDDKGRLMIRKQTNRRIYLALGGVSGSLFYSGIGYTSKPAESTAAIEQIAASLKRRDGMVFCEASFALEWKPGIRCAWTGGEYNRGVVREVIMEGVARLHNQALVAQPGNPVLRIELPNGNRIIRLSHRVVKKS